MHLHTLLGVKCFFESLAKSFVDVLHRTGADLVLSGLVVMILLDVGLPAGHWHAMFFPSQAMEHTHLVPSRATPLTGKD